MKNYKFLYFGDWHKSPLPHFALLFAAPVSIFGSAYFNICLWLC